MSINQVTAEAMALPLGDRVELLLKIQDSLPEEKKLNFDPDCLREVVRWADERESVKAVGEDA